MKKSNNLKIGIIGHGFVGKATDYGFSRSVDKFIVDPIYETTIKDLSTFKPEVIFICVPTPMGPEGNQDSSILESVILEVIKECPESIKVIKSTVVPSVLKKLNELDKNLVYNPEFLREKHAEEDFQNSPMIIIGGEKEASSRVSEIYLENSICTTRDHVFVSIETASLIKYSINTFLATKVIFFNEIHQLFLNEEGSDTWSKFIEVMSKDKRIGETHMDVPGHDAKFGFGGACFPKDCTALINYAEDIGVDLSILKRVVNKNNSIRTKYSDLELREKDQNITFNDKI